MAADTPRLYSVTLHSQENDQFRRVTLPAQDADDAAAQCEAREAEYANYQAASDTLEAAREVALYVPKDTDVDGRFYRAGRVIPAAADEVRAPLLSASAGAVNNEGDDATVWAVPAGSRPSSRLRAEYATHLQEKPYVVDRVGALDEQMVLASMFGLGWQKQIAGSTGRWVWASDTIKVSLHTSTYSPNIDTHDFWNDAVNEVTGTGYTTGGATLGTKTDEYDSATDQARLKAANTSWTTSTITARHAIIYVDLAGASSTDTLIGWVNFESDVNTTAGTLQITWDATGGIFLIDVT